MTSSMVWVDGELLDADRARVSPFDHGILVGDGIFETLGVYRGVPFAWRRHHERLAWSAKQLGLAVPDSGALRVAADAVLGANQGDGRSAADHGDRRPLPAGLGARRRSPDGDRGRGPARARPPTEWVVTVPWSRNERGATAGSRPSRTPTTCARARLRARA